MCQILPVAKVQVHEHANAKIPHLMQLRVLMRGPQQYAQKEHLASQKRSVVGKSKAGDGVKNYWGGLVRVEVTGAQQIRTNMY